MSENWKLTGIFQELIYQVKKWNCGGHKLPSMIRIMVSLSCTTWQSCLRHCKPGGHKRLLTKNSMDGQEATPVWSWTCHSTAKVESIQELSFRLQIQKQNYNFDPCLKMFNFHVKNELNSFENEFFKES